MLINEMALPSGKDKRKFWYHGTPGDKDSGKKLNSIIRKGIKPGNLTTNRFGWSPIENAVYITDDLATAGSYMFDTENEDSEYGYIVVFNGEDLSDVVIDEESLRFLVLKAYGEISLNGNVNEHELSFVRKIASKYQLESKIISKDFRLSLNATKKLTKLLTQGEMLILSDLCKKFLKTSSLAHSGSIKPMKIYLCSIDVAVNELKKYSDLQKHCELVWRMQ